MMKFYSLKIGMISALRRSTTPARMVGEVVSRRNISVR
jgi:hypothetical protein